MSYILLITGPTGSGKTTVSRRLAKIINKCVNIEVDYVKHFIVNGFNYEYTPEGDKQWELVGDNLGLLARNFIKSGYNVIINGYLHDAGLKKLLQHTKMTDKIILLPSLGVNMARDNGRDEESVMGDEMVNKHHQHLSSSNLYTDFVKIDTTNHEIEETVSNILDAIGYTEK